MWIATDVDGRVIAVQDVSTDETTEGDVRLQIFENLRRHDPSEVVILMRAEAIDLVRSLHESLGLPPILRTWASSDIR